MISIPWPRSATTENPLERYLQWVVDLWFSSVWLKPLEFFLRFYNHSPKINVNSPWDASVLLHTNHSIEAEVSFKGLFKYELCSLDWILSFQSFPYIYFHDFIAAMLDDLKDLVLVFGFYHHVFFPLILMENDARAIYARPEVHFLTRMEYLQDRK